MKRVHIFLFSIFIFSGFLSASPKLNWKVDTTEFKEASVYPIYRLADKDITIEWTSFCKDGVTILYGDEILIKEAEGKFVLSSKELASMPETFEIKLKVNSKGGEVRKFKIETFSEPREIKLTCEQFGMTERYEIIFDEKEWDRDLVIQEIELEFPKSIYVRKSLSSARYLEVYAKWEYYTKERDVVGHLRWEDQYKSKRDLPAVPKGLWTFRFWNSPRQQINPDIQPTSFEPVVLFTIGAKEVL